MEYDYSKISASRYLFITDSSSEKIHGWENWSLLVKNCTILSEEDFTSKSNIHRQKSHRNMIISCFSLIRCMMDWWDFNIVIHLTGIWVKILIRYTLKLRFDARWCLYHRYQESLGIWLESRRIKMNHAVRYHSFHWCRFAYPLCWNSYVAVGRQKGFSKFYYGVGNQRIESPRQIDYQFIIEKWRDR